MTNPSLRRYFRHGLFPQMIVFEAVARLGSVTGAAAELHLAQPTVSGLIRKLADNLGVALFEPRGRKLQLAAAGHELLAACGELRDLFAGIDQRLAALRPGGPAPLRIGAAPGARFLAARLLAGFCARRPASQASLHVAPRAALLARLSDGADELCLVSTPPDPLRFSMDVVAVEALCIYAPAGHPLAGGVAAPEEIARHGLVVRERGARLRDAMLSGCTDWGRAPSIRAELASNEAIAEAIASGLGVGLLPEDEAQSALRAGAIVPLVVPGFPLYREWRLTAVKGGRLTPSAASFRGEVVEASRERRAAFMPGRRQAEVLETSEAL